ncbi:hypothetical protein D3C72_2587570 [compost metagenome]
MDECAALLEISGEAVRTFVHPAYLCGYAALEPAAERARPPLPAGDGGGLLARMWRSVRQRGGG